MSATNAFENALLSLILTNAAIANVGDSSGLQPSSTAGVFYISLHTADPGESGAQNTSEAGYTSYDRVDVARSTDEWTVATGVADNDNAIDFPTATGGTADITNCGVGSDSSGAGNLFLYGSATLSVSNGITPSFAAGALDISCD